MKKYQLPEFLACVVSQEVYERWLHRKAAAHVRRDRKRGNTTAANEQYKVAIHKAARDSNGVDAYTGENLDWTLISRYNNDQSKRGGRGYKKRFALLPTVDHLGAATRKADFRICAWRTNDAKNDLPYMEFLELCKKVVTASKRVAESR
ncbi:MAG: hypothetical protein ABSC21_06600 [Terriglobia bacterium]|jgi:hypothetical protein